MSATEIPKMTDKQLRNEVQLLRDELAIFKRKYDDIIYNLDSDNFSGRFRAEQGNMKAQVEATAEAIKAMVTDTDLNAVLESYLEITAGSITAAVSKVDEDLRAAFTSELQTTADGIYATVSESYDDLDTRVTSISATADGINSRVTDLEVFKSSTFIQAGDGFTLDGEKTTFTGVIYLTDNDKVKQFGIFHDESQFGMDQVLMHSATNSVIPLVLGDEDGAVYVREAVAGSEVATRQWVKDNAGSGGSGIAKFG